MKLIDSHIHLSSLDNQHLLPWQGDHPLNKQCRLEEYIAGIHQDIDVEGVIVIEFCANTTDNHQATVDEYNYYSRIVQRTLASEGSNQYSHLIKGIIPWAPIPEGPSQLQSYIDRLKDDSFAYVKGFRYLLQDKPAGVMVQPQFIASLNWLYDHDYVFDWGIDLRSGGWWQFDETLQVFQQAPKVKYIINHLCKPSYKPHDVTRWGEYMRRFYELTPNSYMKLSGGFSELEAGITIDQAVAAIYPWFEIIFQLWGVNRILWASNWPVCAMFTDDIVGNWYQITERLFDRVHMSEADRDKIYRLNYRQAYNVT